MNIDLATLLRTERLAAQYPAVREALADLDPPDLARAGRLLAQVPAEDIIRAHPSTPTLTIAVTGHGTVAPVVPPLTAELARHGIALRPLVTDFDSYLAELGDPSSQVHTAQPDLVLAVLDPLLFADDLPNPWRVGDAEQVFASRLAVLENLTAGFAARSQATLVLNTVPLTRRLTGQLVDYRSRNRLSVLWRELNSRLLALADRHPNVVVIDLDPLIADAGPANDVRLSVYAKAHLAPELLGQYAREVAHLGRAQLGHLRKCLVLDLDNTVWGGTLGDDGVEGIEVADTPRGEAFRAVQRLAKQIGSQGILLAAVSKNDQEPVLDALRDHPQMTLRENDFVRIHADWRPKPESLVELAAELNIGLDSLVFVDDSPSERGSVRQALPSVTVVAVDDEPAAHITQLLADGWFDTRDLTAEDRDRPSLYQADLARRDLLQTIGSYDDYLRSLDVAVKLAPTATADTARVSQLTLRTNQFNLTTVRLQQPDVEKLCADPSTLALAIRSRDRFGDNGLVGCAFAHRDGDLLHVDNFILSCRVFARGIEQACIGSLLRHARDTGVKAVLARYRPTKKNGKIRTFYPQAGFTLTGTDTDDGSLLFQHDLTDLPAPPAHIQLSAEYEETVP
jgi:FkbH-like protein